MPVRITQEELQKLFGVSVPTNAVQALMMHDDVESLRDTLRQMSEDLKPFTYTARIVIDLDLRVTGTLGPDEALSASAVLERGVRDSFTALIRYGLPSPLGISAVTQPEISVNLEKKWKE